MGTIRSGRKPKPTALKVLQGAKLRPSNRKEPKYAVGEPTCPPLVANDPNVKAKWDELVAMFLKSRVLTEAHGEMLAVLATTWVDFVRTYEQWRAAGFPVVDERGKPDAYAARVEKLREQLTRRLGEFGATPVMGPKVQAQTPEEPDEFEVFLGGKPHSA